MKIEKFVKKNSGMYKLFLDNDEVIELHEDLILKEDAAVFTKKTDKIGKITYNLNLKKVKAPVKEGDIVGNLKIKEDENVIREVPITVRESVEKCNLFELYFRHLTDIFKGDVSL